MTKSGAIQISAKYLNSDQKYSLNLFSLVSASVVTCITLTITNRFISLYAAVFEKPEADNP